MGTFGPQHCYHSVSILHLVRNSGKNLPEIVDITEVVTVGDSALCPRVSSLVVAIALPEASGICTAEVKPIPFTHFSWGFPLHTDDGKQNADWRLNSAMIRCTRIAGYLASW